MKKGVLVLEDGAIFEGRGFGVEGTQTGELVFNTSMTGYQEILTDPSYYQQIVTMTVPHVGNTGINTDDTESAKVWVSGFVVRALSPIVSNWRNTGTLDGVLRDNCVIGLTEMPTRAIVRHIRDRGAMRAVVAHGEAAYDSAALLALARSSLDMSGANLVDAVTTPEPYHWTAHSDAQWYSDDAHSVTSPLVVAYDYGIKHNILRMLTDRGVRVTVVPADTTAQAVLALEPDGVFLSNGPGDPAAVTYAIESIEQLLGKVPVFGICLGHQLLALALGGKTEKMRFGHRGGNQPVKNLLTGTVEISAHNHGFAVTADSDLHGGEITHINLNDNTVEGLRHTGLKAFSVQYHPESSPGPHDSLYLFDEFVEALQSRNAVLE